VRKGLQMQPRHELSREPDRVPGSRHLGGESLLLRAVSGNVVFVDSALIRFAPAQNARTILKSSPKILTKPNPRTDYRELCLLDVRRKLRDTYADQKRATPVSDPWMELEWFYNTANWALSNHHEPTFSRAEQEQMTAVAAQALNDWLRQALIYCQITDLGMQNSTMGFDTSPHTWIRLLCINWDRLVALLDKAEINAKAKAAIRKQMEQKQRGIDAMRWSRKAFWTGPAKHPKSKGAVTSFGLG
jgi:hypothetical protein